MKAITQSWRTRRALNCLASEVSTYVMCEDDIKRQRLRLEFHLLF